MKQHPHLSAREIWSEFAVDQNPKWRKAQARQHPNARIIWTCQRCGTHFQKSVKQRLQHQAHCPFCYPVHPHRAKQMQSVAYLYPWLMKSWHPTKNGHLNAFELRPKTAVRVWWQCPTCNGEWHTTIQQRVRWESGCPHCRAALKKQRRDGRFPS